MRQNANWMSRIYANRTRCHEANPVNEKRLIFMKGRVKLYIISWVITHNVFHFSGLTCINIIMANLWFVFYLFCSPFSFSWKRHLSCGDEIYDEILNKYFLSKLI